MADAQPGIDGTVATFATFALVAAAVVAIEPWATQHPAPPRPPPEQAQDEPTDDDEHPAKRAVVGRPTSKGARAEPTAPPQPRVHDGLPRSAIREVVRDNVADVRACYDLARKADPTTSARLSVEFTIGANGRVKGTNLLVDHDDRQGRRVGDCIAAASARWTFPRPDGGADVVVTYPFFIKGE